MKPRNFDELTKALATNPSRRQALKTIVAMGVGSLFGLGSVGSALAAPNSCRPLGAHCTKAKQCCSHKCCGNGLCGPKRFC